jgi:hypothetical protein
MAFRLMGIVIALTALVAAASGADHDFRCDTQIFVGTAKEPVQEGLTIFTGGLVYDFLLTAPEEVALYDLNRSQFTLLDKSRKAKTTIQSDDLISFVAAYRISDAPKTELFKFCLHPSFDEEYTDGVLTLRSKILTYRVTCVKPEIPGADKRYREFADWSARLNSMRAGNLPPFPRMEMNKSLAARHMLPSKIERTITTTHLTGKRTEAIRSEHLFNKSLSVQDHRRIEKVGDYLTQFAPLPIEEYLDVKKLK